MNYTEAINQLNTSLDHRVSFDQLSELYRGNKPNNYHTKPQHTVTFLTSLLNHTEAITKIAISLDHKNAVTFFNQLSESYRGS